MLLSTRSPSVTTWTSASLQKMEMHLNGFEGLSKSQQGGLRLVTQTPPVLLNKDSCNQKGGHLAPQRIAKDTACMH
jgi:hypothetical protein